MNILIVGCGSLGANIACFLEEHGHQISVVAENSSDFELLSDDFNGYKTTGVSIDSHILQNAGINNCDALLAMSSDDNVNIMVAQMAKTIYNVPTVISRINDPIRESLYSHFGLTTICPTNLTAEGVVSMLNGSREFKNVSLDTCTLSFRTIPVEKNMSGKIPSEISVREGEKVIAVIHEDSTTVFAEDSGPVLSITDKLIFSKIVD